MSVSRIDSTAWKVAELILARQTLLLLLVVGAASCRSDTTGVFEQAAPAPAALPKPVTQSAASNVPSRPFMIVARRRHNPKAFTQGLLFDTHGALIETSGHYGQSWLARLTPGSGREIEKKSRLADRYFAEGASLLENTLYVLTWRAGRCLLYSPDTLRQTGTLSYAGEGWGLTNNGRELIMSNGSSTLSFRTPGDFIETRQLQVTMAGKKLRGLNELEWAHDKIYANVWYRDYIVAIDPQSGAVTEKIELGDVRRQQGDRADVLNGIAYNAKSDTFWVTGKYWPQILEIKLNAPH